MKKFDKTIALINVDVTNDFAEQWGALYVQGGEQIVPVLNELRENFQTVLWTKEEHDAQHDFFASSIAGKQPLDEIETAFGKQYLWPDHCVKGTAGVEFHKDLIVKPEDMVVVKGTDPTMHAYSAVYMDDRKTIIQYPDGKTMPQKLREAGIETVVVTGLAYDFCAGMTAYDLAKEGFNVVLLEDAARSINIPVNDNGRTTVNIMDEMLEEAKVLVTQSIALEHVLNKNGFNKKLCI